MRIRRPAKLVDPVVKTLLVGEITGITRAAVIQPDSIEIRLVARGCLASIGDETTVRRVGRTAVPPAIGSRDVDRLGVRVLWVHRNQPKVGVGRPRLVAVVVGDHAQLAAVG